MPNGNFKRMIYVLIVIGIIAVMSVVLYFKVMQDEKDSSWMLMEDSANAAAHEIRLKFEDDIAILRLTGRVLAQSEEINAQQEKALNQQMTSDTMIFSEIQVLFPDDTMLHSGGEKSYSERNQSFADLVKQGEQISTRMTNPKTGKETVYYDIPLSTDGQTYAILTGVIDVEALDNVFQPELYNGAGEFCVVDSKDGSYIMDSWHEELTNAYETPERKRLKAYEDVDLKSEIQQQNTGVLAFESKTNGLDTYMYYRPIGIFDWELLIFAQEDVVFSQLQYLKKLLLIAGIIEIILLALYFFWNLRATNRLEKSRREALKQLKISGTLIDCVTELNTNRDINLSIQNLLRIITEYFDADRTHIFSVDGEGKTFAEQYEYVKEGSDSLSRSMPIFMASQFAEALEAFGNDQVYFISDPDQVQETKLYDIMKTHNISELFAVPLQIDGNFCGFISVDNPRQGYEEEALLFSLRFFVANSLAMKQKQEQLRTLSYRDSLTNLYNRNKFMQLLEQGTKEKMRRVGAAYMDLNGLKEINDRKGHEAGDAFIKKATGVITEVFGDSAYRLGGDEFAVVMMGTEQAEFLTKINEMQEKMQLQDISISVGTLWETECEDLEEMVKAADARMYETKKAHYRRR